MYQEEIYNEAISRIKSRRLRARQEQEQRTDQIRAEIPETAELDRQLRSVCMSILRTLGREDNSERLKAIENHTKQADMMLREILEAHGYPADYLDLHYTCKMCNDTGFVAGRPCKCLKQEIGAVGAERMNAQSQLALCSFSTFSLSYYRSLPTEQYQVMERIYQQCRSYAENFELHRSGNILMIGNTGLGKTHLSLSIASELLAKGYGVIYDSAGSLLQKLEDEHFGRAEGNTMPMLLECDLLILDDFGTEFGTNFTRSMIYTIFNSRINASRPMIVNTNLSKDSLQELYGSRILSRLFSACIMQFYGRDIRLQKSLLQNQS